MIALLAGVGQTVFNYFEGLWVQTLISSAMSCMYLVYKSKCKTLDIGSILQYNVTYGKTHSTYKASQAFDMLMEEIDKRSGSDGNNLSEIE